MRAAEPHRRFVPVCWMRQSDANWLSGSNSLINRERAGNSCDLRRDPSDRGPEKLRIGLVFLGKFPTQRNRELSLGNRDLFPQIREFTGMDQGNQSPHTGKANSRSHRLSVALASLRYRADRSIRLGRVCLAYRREIGASGGAHWGLRDDRQGSRKCTEDTSDRWKYRRRDQRPSHIW